MLHLHHQIFEFQNYHKHYLVFLDLKHPLHLDQQHIYMFHLNQLLKFHKSQLFLYSSYYMSYLPLLNSKQVLMKKDLVQCKLLHF